MNRNLLLHAFRAAATCIPILLGVSTEVEAQVCANSFPTNTHNFFFSATSALGCGPIQIYVNEAARKSSFFQEENLKKSAKKWNEGCSNDPHIPNLIVNWTGTPPTAPNGHCQPFMTTIQINFINERAPDIDGDGLYEAAVYHSGTGIIDVYEKCPPDPNNGLKCFGANFGTIEWNSDWGRDIISHEIGHAFGLAHDDCENSIMANVFGSNQPSSFRKINAEHCYLVNRLTDAGDQCNNMSQTDPALPHPCEQITPIGSEAPSDTGFNLEYQFYPYAGPDICRYNPFACDSIGGIPNIILECVEVTDQFGSSFKVCNWVVEHAVQQGKYSHLQAGDRRTAPRIHVSLPAAGDVASGTIPITGWAVDLGGVSNVIVAVDGITTPVSGLQTGLFNLQACTPPLGHWHSACNPFSGFSANLDTSTLSDGPHTIMVTAFDNEDLSTARHVDVVVDNSCVTTPPPAVSITSPANGATVSGTVQVQANASTPHAQGIERVNFNVDWVFQAGDFSLPYTFNWNTANFTDGTHVLRARAYDYCGQNTVSVPITVTVQNGPQPSPPGISIDWPASGQIVSGTSVNLDGWAVDETGITSLSFQLDGVPLTLNSSHTWHSRTDICSNPVGQNDPRCPNVGWRGVFNSTAFADGAHTLKVIASDGNSTANSSRTITINNNPGGVTATFSPTDDAFVEQALPNTPNGSGPHLSVRHFTQEQGRHSFLKFNVTGIAGPITSAKLVLTESAGIDVPSLLIWEVLNNNWNEATVTWNTIPTPYELRSTEYNLAKNTTHEIDVTSSVDGNGEITIGLSSHTHQDLFFGSKDAGIAGKRPKLKVTYQP